MIKDRKPKGKVKAWIERQKIAVKLWLYRRAVLVGLGFVGLNALDGYAQRIMVASGAQHMIDANSFLAPIASHWSLSLRGVLAAAVIGVLTWVKRRKGKA